ncbi:hypothetical protein E4U17_001896 [Claviceps sp. LM77 group G4]|nr:hypothetical protein E4U17_001896 [Claviceps sp. LM77 group G4]KAG6042752.1 hypothetical protein E4U33_001836 [Claviceps sp. LM78 group G4]
MERRAGEEFLTKAPVDLPQLEANNNKRYNPQVQIQQQYQQQVTTNSHWSGDEEAILLAKRSAHMQWKDVSSYLPGRTPQSCRAHHHILNRRYNGWSLELLNELCQQYAILKQRMWTQIGETMSVKWQVAENMHWELGKDGIAELAGEPLALQPAANPSLTPREPDQTLEEWFADESNIWVDEIYELFSAEEPYNDDTVTP